MQRQEIIVLKQKSHHKVSNEHVIAINPRTKRPVHFVFVDNQSSSNGTFESPYPTLALAQDNSKPNDVIYVFSGDGTTKGMDQGISLQDGQNFWGSGNDQLLKTQFGEITIPAFTKQPPQITNLTGSALTLARNNRVSGFSIQGPFQEGIFGSSVGNLSIKNTLVFGSQNSDGIQISETDTQRTHISFDKVALVSNANNGLNFSAGPGTNVNFSMTESLVRSNGSALTGTFNGIVYNSNGTSKIAFEKNLIDNNNITSVRLQCEVLDKLSFKKNAVTNSGTGLIGTFNHGLKTQRMIFENNLFENNAGSAVIITSSDANLPQVDFICRSNEFLRNFTQQVFLDSAAIQTNVLVKHNVFKGHSLRGVTVNTANSEGSSRSAGGAPFPSWEGRRQRSIWQCRSQSKSSELNRAQYIRNFLNLSCTRGRSCRNPTDPV